MTTEIVYEKINDEFSQAKYGDMNVIIINSNGYINATKLCVIGGKPFSRWLDNKSSKELCIYFENEIKNKAYIIKTGGNNELRGTYVHPDLIPHIACWVSPAFTIKISKIINEWRNLTIINEKQFWIDMNKSFIETKELARDDNYESKYRDKIADEENGFTEVNTKYGFIDVLTDIKIIEVKLAINYKYAIGQVQCYGLEFPDRELWIYLFDHKDSNKEIIEECCNAFNIKIKYMDDI